MRESERERERRERELSNLPWSMWEFTDALDKYTRLIKVPSTTLMYTS